MQCFLQFLVALHLGGENPGPRRRGGRKKPAAPDDQLAGEHAETLEIFLLLLKHRQATV